MFSSRTILLLRHEAGELADAAAGSRWFRTAVALAALALATCKDSVGPTKVASIVVTSNIDSIIATGHSAQFTAVARDQSGSVVNAAFAWTSSNPPVATVSTGGVVQGLTAGNATITAEADGRTGRLVVHVVAADLHAVRALLADPLRPYLVSRLSTTRNSIESALSTADQAVTSGNIAALNQSLTVVANQVSAATVADDRALLGTLVLLTNFAIRLLHL